MEIHQGHLPRPLGRRGILDQMDPGRFGRVRGRQPQAAPRIEQDDAGILGVRLDSVDPRLQQATPFPVFRLLVEASDQGSEGSVLEQRFGIGQPFLAPLHQLAHLQVGNGGELALNLRAIVPLIVPVVEIAGRHDACGQADIDQSQQPSRAARIPRTGAGGLSGHGSLVSRRVFCPIGPSGLQQSGNRLRRRPARPL